MWKNFNKQIDELMETLTPFLFFGYFATVIGLTFFESPDQTRLSKEQSEASTTFRAVIMRGDNVRFYIPRESFESVPYPDRAALMSQISKDWCEMANGLFLPSVYLYDIKTGDKLDSHNCVWASIRKAFSDEKRR